MRKIKCPSCKKDTVYDIKNPNRPFCSKRCKITDLGAWANQEYTLPDQSPQDIDQEKTQENKK